MDIKKSINDAIKKLSSDGIAKFDSSGGSVVIILFEL